MAKSRLDEGKKIPETDYSYLYWQALSNGYFDSAKELIKMGARPLQKIKGSILSRQDPLHFLYRYPQLSAFAIRQLCDDATKDAENFIFNEISKKNVDKLDPRVLSIIQHLLLDNIKFHAQLRTQRMGSFISDPLFRSIFFDYLSSQGIKTLSGLLTHNRAFISGIHLTCNYIEKIFSHAIKKAVNESNQERVDALLQFYKKNVKELWQNVGINPEAPECMVDEFAAHHLLVSMISHFVSTDKIEIADYLFRSAHRALQEHCFFVNLVEDRNNTIQNFLLLGYDFKEVQADMLKRYNITEFTDERAFQTLQALVFYQNYLRENPTDSLMQQFEQYRLRLLNPSCLNQTPEVLRQELAAIHSKLPQLFSEVFTRLEGDLKRDKALQELLLPLIPVAPVNNIVCEYETGYNGFPSVAKEAKSDVYGHNHAEEKIASVPSELPMSAKFARENLAGLQFPVSAVGKFFSTHASEKTQQANEWLKTIGSEQSDLFVLQLAFALMKSSSMGKTVIDKPLPKELLDATTGKPEFRKILETDLQNKLSAGMRSFGMTDQAISEMTFNTLSKPKIASAATLVNS